MSVPVKVAIVIPCLNEELTIAQVVTLAKKFIPAVIVVDDGSSDATATQARNAGATVIRHDSPRGKGSALTTGWTHAIENGFDWALCMDGDGQHSPADIPRFLQSTGAPLVIGNRMSNPHVMPALRKAVNRWMSRRISNLTGQELPDTQCGFRLMRLDAWSALQLSTSHFEIESDLLLAFIAAGHAVKFVPVQVIYSNERSKIRPVRDTVRWLRWWKTARAQFVQRKATPALECKPVTT